MLQDTLAAGNDPPEFDLDDDSDVDSHDLDYWLSTIAQTVPGDTNFDRRVNITDLANLSAYMNRAGAWSVGDFDRHSDTTSTLGTVTLADYAILAGNYGDDGTRSARGTVPEPFATTSALAIAGVLLSRRKLH